MRHPVRLTVCGLLAAGSFSLAVALPGGIASAKTPKITCTGLSGSETSQSLTGCSPTTDIGGASATDGDITEMLNAKATAFTATSTVTWANSETSTEAAKGKITYWSATKNKDKCPTLGGAGATQLAEIKESGTLNGGTDTALIGGKTKGTDCAYIPAGGAITVVNFPGTLVDY